MCKICLIWQDWKRSSMWFNVVRIIGYLWTVCNVWSALLLLRYMNPETGAEKENRGNSSCSNQQHCYQLQHHCPQQLNSPRPPSNWYIGRRPRTAFTNNQVINQSISLSISHSDKWILRKDSLSFKHWVHSNICFQCCSFMFVTFVFSLLIC